MTGKIKYGKTTLPHVAGCGCYDCIRNPEAYQPEEYDPELEAILMEGDRREALEQDKAFMRHWERKGEGW